MGGASWSQALLPPASWAVVQLCAATGPPHPSQRTLAVELQRLSIQFRKQQKAYLNRLRSKDGAGAGAGSSFDLLGVEGQAGRQQQEDYDPGFSDMQARWGRCVGSGW